MMSYLDNQEYDKNTNFTQEQLGKLTAADVMKWFNFETYDVPEPPEGHDMRPLVRNNSLKYWK